MRRDAACWMTISASRHVIFAVCLLATAGVQADEAQPGGAATSDRPIDTSAFSRPSANMPFERQLDFRVGDGIFRKLWASSPSSTTSSDGLGPLFNARSCQSCHLKDGRGRPPANRDEEPVSLFLRLSIPPQTDDDRRLLGDLMRNAIPEPTYGTQLQNFSVQGVLAEGRMAIDYKPVTVRFADGDTVTLRQPQYSVKNLNYGPLHPQVMLSPRVTPPMIGLGLLELIPESDILLRADPEDIDGDGIAGRPNQAWSRAQGRGMLGRFGWKAGVPTIADQVAEAFAGDLGLSTPLQPKASHGDCMPLQRACLQMPVGDDPHEGVEVTRRMFELVVFYASHLAVPARRSPQVPAVKRGAALFAAAGCGGCHVPRYTTGHEPARPELSNQTIFPYTDLLLHEMGEGLADNRPEGLASGRHWRTPPLWGIGLTKTVSGHDFLLHDGRARGVLEAILWHDGEAAKAKHRVLQMNREERGDLLAFINSL